MTMSHCKINDGGGGRDRGRERDASAAPGGDGYDGEEGRSNAGDGDGGSRVCDAAAVAAAAVATAPQSELAPRPEGPSPHRDGMVRIPRDGTNPVPYPNQNRKIAEADAAVESEDIDRDSEARNGATKAAAATACADDRNGGGLGRSDADASMEGGVSEDGRAAAEWEEGGDDSVPQGDALATNDGELENVADTLMKDGGADVVRGANNLNEKGSEDAQESSGAPTEEETSVKLEEQSDAAAARTSKPWVKNQRNNVKQNVNRNAVDASMKRGLVNDHPATDLQNEKGSEVAVESHVKITEDVFFGDSSRNGYDTEEESPLASEKVDEKTSAPRSADVATQTTDRTTESSKRQLLSSQSCSSVSFNQALKAALDTYHTSNTLMRNSNNPPPPKPPPFLSHQEECTLKTALAFVMARSQLSKNKKKVLRDTARSAEYADDGGSRVLSRFLSGGKKKHGYAASSKSNSLNFPTGRRNIPRNDRLWHPSNNPPDRMGSRSSGLLGGLLPLPSPSHNRIIVSSMHSNATNKASFAWDRKLKHVRDVLKLAVSAILPLYRGALDEEVCDAGSPQNKLKKSVPGRNDDDGANALLEKKERTGDGEVDDATPVRRRPCAVYDYQSAVQPSTVTNDEASSMPQCKSGREHHLRHQANLDGLCQHVIVRKNGLIREEEWKRDRLPGGRRTVVAKKSDGGVDHSNENESPTVVTDKSREESSKNSTTHQRGNNRIYLARDVIAKLIYNDIIGDAYRHGSPRRSASSNHPHLPWWISSSIIEQECAEQRIEKIMASCHVLHRLLFLDKNSSLGTEIVVSICSILSDLYRNQYNGRIGNDSSSEQDGSWEHVHYTDGASKSNEDAQSNISNKEKQPTQNENPNKDRRQVVSSGWSAVPSASSACIDDRHERRRRAVDALSQERQPRWRCSSKNKGRFHSGVKRSYNHGKDENAIQNNSKDTQLSLPRIGDVLAVNLLHLLEGAAAIRLHHRQQAVAAHFASSHSPSSQGGDQEYMFDRAASAAATEVLTEIRSNVTPRELILPLHAEDATAFYYNEKVRVGAGSLVLLLPGAKLMLRLHLFDLMNKLALYEQV